MSRVIGAAAVTALLGVIVLVPAALAQSAGAQLRGRLSSDLLGELRGGVVLIECPGDPPVARMSTPAPDGDFALDDLPEGICFLSAEGQDHRPLRRRPVLLQAARQTEVDLQLPFAGVTGGPDRSFDDGFGDGLPLPARTLPALVRGAIPGRRQYRLDGFRFSRSDGRAVVELPLWALSDVVAPWIVPPQDQAFAAGFPVAVRTRSGSNKLEAAALTWHERRLNQASVSVFGPAIKDRLWFSATVEGEQRGDDLDASERAGRGLGKLVWQVSQRHRLALLAAGSLPALATAAEGASLAGLTSESLLADNLVLRLQAGWCEGPQGLLRLEHFADSRALGDHRWQLEISAGQPGDRAARGILLQDDWRIARVLTVIPAVAWGRALVPRLALVWDATADGRAALRATGGRDVLAAGIERELLRDLVTSLDIVRSSGPLDETESIGHEGPRRVVGRLGLHRRVGRWRVDVIHAQARKTFLFRGALAWAWTDALTLSTLATHDQTWTLALRARTQLGRWFGFPLAVDTDAYSHADQRGLRLALRTSY